MSITVPMRGSNPQRTLSHRNLRVRDVTESTEDGFSGVGFPGVGFPGVGFPSVGSAGATWMPTEECFYVSKAPWRWGFALLHWWLTRDDCERVFVVCSM